MIESRLGPAAETLLLRLVTSTRFTIIDLADVDYQRCIELIDTYADLGLGFVAASIVAVAERLDITTVATLNRRDFAVVRPAHRGIFFRRCSCSSSRSPPSSASTAHQRPRAAGWKHASAPNSGQRRAAQQRKTSWRWATTIPTSRHRVGYRCCHKHGRRFRQLGWRVSSTTPFERSRHRGHRSNNHRSGYRSRLQASDERDEQCWRASGYDTIHVVGGFGLLQEYSTEEGLLGWNVDT